MESSLGYNVTGKFFLRNQMKTTQENVDFQFGLTNLRYIFAKLLMYEHYSYKKDVWTKFINGIECMNVNYNYISLLRLGI